MQPYKASVKQQYSSASPAQMLVGDAGMSFSLVCTKHNLAYSLCSSWSAQPHNGLQAKGMLPAYQLSTDTMRTFERQPCNSFAEELTWLGQMPPPEPRTAFMLLKILYKHSTADDHYLLSTREYNTQDFTIAAMLALDLQDHTAFLAHVGAYTPA